MKIFFSVKSFSFFSSHLYTSLRGQKGQGEEEGEISPNQSRSKVPLIQLFSLCWNVVVSWE